MNNPYDYNIDPQELTPWGRDRLERGRRADRVTMIAAIAAIIAGVATLIYTL
jgi:hypothetical protein